MNQKARMAVPLDEKRPQRGAFTGTAAALHQLTSVMQQVHQGGIAKSLGDAAPGQHEKTARHRDEIAPFHLSSSMTKAVNDDTTVSGQRQASSGSSALTHVCCKSVSMSQRRSVATCGSSSARLPPRAM